MRCIFCNNILTTQEACTKFVGGGYTEACTPCLDTMDAKVVVPSRFLKGHNDDDDIPGVDDIPPWEDSPLSYSDIEEDDD